MSVKLYLRDNTTGTVHEYGTNRHDSLILQEDGSLHYHNLQNGCGTQDDYTFVLEDGSDPRESDDWQSEPYVDIGGEPERRDEYDITTTSDTGYIRKTDALAAINEIDENAGSRGSYIRNDEDIQRDSALYAIEKIPSADVVPVRHGTWVEAKVASIHLEDGAKLVPTFKCSRCGRFSFAKEPYCNCGAKMDGGPKGDE